MIKLLNNYIPQHIKYLTLIYLLGTLFFMMFRAIFVFTSKDLLPPNSTNIVINAFEVGLRFDNVISCFVLSIPFALFTVISFFKFNKMHIYKFITIYISLFYTASFIICATDIPYFKYNYSRLTIAIFNWIDTPDMMLKFVFSDVTYILYLIVLIVIIIIFTILSGKIKRKTLIKSEEKSTILLRIIYTLLFSFLIFMGMRGRKESPIKEGHACVSANAFINQIALNPVFTFVKSFSNKIYFIDNKLALKEVKRYLNIVNNNEYDSPVAREIVPDSSFNKYNVVVVIMESMTANNLKRFGNKNNITPNLDSIANNGYSFDNIWSAGKHTSNGVYSTLYSFPAIWSVRPTSNTERTKYSGLPGVLKQNGYSTIYFTNHGTSFDNIGEFLPSNYFDKIVSQSDYPQEKVVGMYGVPDHVMFEKGILTITELSQNNKHFFATFMTTSNHEPFIIPNDVLFKPKNSSLKKQIVEYSDWSIGYFMKMASKQSWFDSTIFVFIADHGAFIGEEKYSIPLSFHHIPFIIYSPKLFNPKQFSNLGGQLDVFPTVMDLLNAKYVNNTFGINLLKEQRPYIYFSEDNKLVCLNNDFMYVISKEKEETLFKFNSNNLSNCISENKIVADSMKKYMFTMLQVSQWMLEHKMTNVINSP